MLAQSIHQHQSKFSTLNQPAVSEIVLPSSEESSAELILPMLAHLSKQTDERWLTWICSKRLPKELFEHYGFNLKKVRVICSPSDEDTLWLMWDALNNGTSAFVVGSIATPASVQQRERALLEKACIGGESRALLLKYSNTSNSF